MSSYLQSNQPYQRVDDGIGAGLIGGAVVGGAMAGAAHKWGNQAIASGREGVKQKMRTSQNNMEATMGRDGVSSVDSIGAQRTHSKNVNRGVSQMKTLHDLEGLHDKGFKGGIKGKAAAYGGSILAGAVLGGIGDAIV